MEPTVTIPQAENPRIPKKVRFRENDEYEDSNRKMQGMDLTENPESFTNQKSFRDVAMGNVDHIAGNIKNGGGFKDIELAEEDLSSTTEEGIPSIRFSARVMAMVDQEMGNTVIVKLLGRRASFPVLLNKLQLLWNFTRGFHMMDLDNEYHLIKFNSAEDATRVLADGPWVIFGQYLTVQPWMPDFDTDLPYPRQSPMWIRLPGLPAEFYRKGFLSHIAGLIGKVVKIDTQTESAARGKFARIAVMVNLDNPLISKIRIQGRLQRVEYESLPVICYGCGRYGHVKDNCSELKGPEEETHASTDQAPRESSEGKEKIATGIKARVQAESFGSWMMVERRRGRAAGAGNHGRPVTQRPEASGSRFSALADVVVDPTDPQSSGEGQGQRIANPTDSRMDREGANGPRGFQFGMSSQKVGRSPRKKNSPAVVKLNYGKEMQGNQNRPNRASPGENELNQTRYNDHLLAAQTKQVNTSLPSSSNSSVQMCDINTKWRDVAREGTTSENGGFKVSGKPKVKWRHRDRKGTDEHFNELRLNPSEALLGVKEAMDSIIVNTVQVAESEAATGVHMQEEEENCGGQNSAMETGDIFPL